MKAPSLFDWEQGIALHAMQGNSVSFPSEGDVSYDFLSCLWKVGLPVQQNPGNQLSSRYDMGCMELSSSSCSEIGVSIDLRRVSQGTSVVA